MRASTGQKRETAGHPYTLTRNPSNPSNPTYTQTLKTSNPKLLKPQIRKSDTESPKNTIPTPQMLSPILFVSQEPVLFDHHPLVIRGLLLELLCCAHMGTCQNYGPLGHVGALIFRIGFWGPLYYIRVIRIGFWGPLYYNYRKEPPK